MPMPMTLRNRQVALLAVLLALTLSLFCTSCSGPATQPTPPPGNGADREVETIDEAARGQIR